MTPNQHNVTYTSLKEQYKSLLEIYSSLKFWPGFACSISWAKNVADYAKYLAAHMPSGGWKCVLIMRF
jgi:hypothetical protein